MNPLREPSDVVAAIILVLICGGALVVSHLFASIIEMLVGALVAVQ